MAVGLMSSSWWPVVAVMLVTCQAVSRFTVLDGITSEQWRSDAACRDNGYDGLAVIDSVVKWDLIQLLLDDLNLPLQTKGVWIGLENTGDEFVWRGGKRLDWAVWGSGQPDSSRTSVMVHLEGDDYVWTSEGSNSMHYVMCDQNYQGLRLTRLAKDVDLTAVTPLQSRSTLGREDCGLLCASLASCLYLTYDDTAASTDNNCAMYRSNLTSLLTAAAAGSVGSAQLYRVTILSE